MRIYILTYTYSIDKESLADHYKVVKKYRKLHLQLEMYFSLSDYYRA